MIGLQSSFTKHTWVSKQTGLVLLAMKVHQKQSSAGQMCLIKCTGKFNSFFLLGTPMVKLGPVWKGYLNQNSQESKWVLSPNHYLEQ